MTTTALPAGLDLRTRSALAELPPTPVALVLGVLGSGVLGLAAGLGATVGLVALIAVVVSCAVLARPAYGGLALVWTVPVLSGLDRGLLVPGVKVSELLVAGVAGVVLLGCGRRRAQPWGALDLVALAYVLVTLLLGLFDLHAHGGSLTVGTLTKLLAPVQFLLLFRAVRVALPTPPLRRLALTGALYAGAAVAALAVVQFAVGGPLDEVLVRLTGSSEALEGSATAVFAGKHDLGGYLLVVLLLAVALLLTPSQRVMGRRRLTVVLGLVALGLVCTVALASIAGALLGVVVMAVRRKRVVQVVGSVAVVAVATALLFGPSLLHLGEGQFTAPPVVTKDSSSLGWLPHGVAYRAVVWEGQYLPALSPHLLTGYGATLPPGVDWQFTESAYLSLLLLGGAPLVLLFLALCLVTYGRARRSGREPDPTQQAIGLLMATLVIVVVVIDATNPYFLNAGLPHAFWALAGLLAVPAGRDAVRLRARPAA